MFFDSFIPILAIYAKEIKMGTWIIYAFYNIIYLNKN
jgi:hypothetical protein